MNKHLARLAVLALIVLLSGCGTNPPQIVYKYELLEPPSSLLEPCPRPAPPAISDYMTADADKKESMMTDHSSDQDTAIVNCNKDKLGVKTWVVNEKAMIKAAEAKANKQ